MFFPTTSTVLSYFSPNETPLTDAKGLLSVTPSDGGNLAISLLRRLSDTNLNTPNNWGNAPSVESVTDEDEDSERRGSMTGGSAASMSGGGRRGSRITDLLDKRKKPENKKRKRDKQGFYWRRMVHDVEDLPRPRTPHLGNTAAMRNPDMTLTLESEGIHANASQVWPSLQQQDLELTNRQGDYAPTSLPSRARNTSNISLQDAPRGNSSRIRLGETRRQDTGNSTVPSLEDDTASINSFKTCPSEPNLNLTGGVVPRQVSDNYETRILGPGSSKTSNNASGGSTSGGNKDPTRIIMRANSYAADPPPGRTASGATLPQLAESPDEPQPLKVRYGIFRLIIVQVLQDK